MKDHNIKMDGRNFVDRPINNDLKTYDDIRKIATGQGDDCTTGFLLDYIYLKKELQINCNRFKQTTKINFVQNNKLILLEI